MRQRIELEKKIVQRKAREGGCVGECLCHETYRRRGGGERPYQACWVKEGHAGLVRFVRHEGKEGEAERRKDGQRRGEERGREEDWTRRGNATEWVIRQEREKMDRRKGSGT